MWAAWKGRTYTTELFLENGAKVNTREKDDDRTALIGAALEGHVETVRVLLRYGADVHLSDRLGTTALMAAAEGGHEEVIGLLTEAGAEK